MSRFIQKPNLPENDVDSVAVSASAGEAIKKLNSLTINTIKINAVKSLPDGLNEHADLQFLHLQKNKVTAPSDNEHLCEQFKTMGFDVENAECLGSDYPNDVFYNAKIIGDNIICNIKTVSKSILRFAEKTSLNIINVKQGYSGCSVCVLNENAIITDDKSIFSAAQIFLNDVTLIEKNSIRLKNYNYGFIGGCCGKISKDVIAFNGSVMSHSSSNLIIDALERNSIRAIELHNGILEDIGGIIPLTEKTP